MAVKEAQAQLATLPERVSVLEVKVETLNEKMDDLKGDVKEMHDCLDRTRDSVMEKLEDMTAEYRNNAAKYYEHAEKLNEQQSEQHTELAGKLEATKDELNNKIKDLEKVKERWMKWGMVALAFAAGAGWIHATTIPQVLKFLGI